MRINPVLRNESKLSVRTRGFTMLMLIYISILAAGVLFFYNQNLESAYINGVDLQSSITLYFAIAIAQALLLMFIVPALTATSICSEREKQTLDMLLSSKLTPFQIIIGKMSASSVKVIMLIICTIPIYVVCGLIGGIRISNILQLILYFIVCTIFVGSMGVFISTYVKTSKVATALTYGLVLFTFIGPIIIAAIILMSSSMRNTGITPKVSWVIYLSPVTGFISMLANQIGMSQNMGIGYMATDMGLSKLSEYITVAIQLVSSGIFLYLATIKLNPLKKNKKFKISKRKTVIKE